jgi:hypothetical protein
MSKLFLSKPTGVPQQTVQSILINSVLTIVDCFVVGLGYVTAAKSSRALVPWNTSKMLRYIPLIFFLWKLVLKLEFISSRSPLFFCTFIAVPPTTYWIQTLRLLLCLSHGSIKRKVPTYGGNFLGSSFVKPATEHSSCLLALHMFGNHLYMCADCDIVISRD